MEVAVAGPGRAVVTRRRRQRPGEGRATRGRPRPGAAPAGEPSPAAVDLCACAGLAGVSVDHQPVRGRVRFSGTWSPKWLTISRFGNHVRGWSDLVAQVA